jgi:hypothetical protein
MYRRFVSILKKYKKNKDKAGKSFDEVLRRMLNTPPKPSVSEKKVASAAHTVAKR